MNQANAPILQVAAKAILVNDEGKILIMREAGDSYAEGTNSGKYHAAAGGRMDPHETYARALRREVAEETGITDFTPLHPVFIGEWWPVIKGKQYHIVAMFTVCKTSSSSVHLSEEHDEYHWITFDDLDKYNLLVAERQAIEAMARVRSELQ